MTKPTNESLNALLTDAKQKQSAWDKWEASGDWRRDGWKELYGETAAAWDLLYEEIRTACRESPLVMATKDEDHTVVVPGVLTSDKMLYYAVSKSAKYTTFGVSLQGVTNIKQQERSNND
jgi:hypothetical protein